MNTITQTQRRFPAALAVAALILAGLALPAGAKKPPKPPPDDPPDPEPTLHYTLVPFQYSTPAPADEHVAALSNPVDGEMIVVGAFSEAGGPLIPASNEAVGTGDPVGSIPAMTALALPAGWPSGEATSVSESGFIAGTASDPSGSGLSTAVIWPGDRVPQALGVFNVAFNRSAAFEVNDEGIVAGYCVDEFSDYSGSVLLPDPVLGWFHDADGDGCNDLMLPINPLESNLETLVLGINDSGVVCGGTTGSSLQAIVIAPDFTLPNPWLEDDGNYGNARMQWLPVLKRGGTARAMAINDDGMVVGWAGVRGTSHPVLWMPVGDDYIIEDLGKPRSFDHARAWAVSDVSPAGDWWAVGDAWDDAFYIDDPINIGALVWHNGTVHTLPDLVDLPAGWVIDRITDVNVDGILTVTGTIDGIPTAFLAYPQSE